MNLLLDGLPRSVTIAGRDVPIDTDYRTGILFEQALRDRNLTNAEKLDTAIRLYFPSDAIRPNELEEAVEALLRFYRCGTDPHERTESDETDTEGTGADPIYDYEHDAGYIYAAFVQAYNIDLAVNNLHWWQFRALFQSLPEDTMFSKIIGYRTAKVPPKATPEQRQRIEELKRLYALPLDADLERAKSDLEAILLNGGNPADLLQ